MHVFALVQRKEWKYALCCMFLEADKARTANCLRSAFGPAVHFAGADQEEVTPSHRLHGALKALYRI
jgi:hypothetical protein